MKSILYFKKLTFHDLFTGKVTKKLHCAIFGIVFRVKLASFQKHETSHKEYLSVN